MQDLNLCKKYGLHYFSSTARYNIHVMPVFQAPELLWHLFTASLKCVLSGFPFQFPCHLSGLHRHFSVLQCFLVFSEVVIFVSCLNCVLGLNKWLINLLGYVFLDSCNASYFICSTQGTVTIQCLAKVLKPLMNHQVHL